MLLHARSLLTRALACCGLAQHMAQKSVQTSINIKKRHDTELQRLQEGGAFHFRAHALLPGGRRATESSDFARQHYRTAFEQVLLLHPFNKPRDRLGSMRRECKRNDMVPVQLLR